LKQQLQQLLHWYNTLPGRDRWLVNVTAVLVILTLFYLMIWEPLYRGLENETIKDQSQQKTLQWMQQAAQQVKQLRRSGQASQRPLSSKPVTLVLEQSLMNAGLKPFVRKIESAGNNSARVKLDNISFDQMLIWLNTIATHNSLQVSSAAIERSDKPGLVNARLRFSRP